ncbi:MAG: transposase, partial [Planctomycetes bacterium]|nr:transposase [Planctomycetota bacterium]
LALHKWDHDRMRDRLQGIVAAEHSGKHSIGILDETSFVKKGDKTPGVQRQHCGTVGKQENCMATVHLAYAAGDFHCLIDGELFLPESWSDDRTRCDEAGIPEDMVYRPKWKIALELVERCLQDQKSELGLDDYEGRRYLGLKRHLVPASVSYLFLARVHQKLRGKKPELTVCQVHTAVGALVRS